MLKTSFALGLAFSIGTEALVPRAEICCFHLTASGEVSGQVGQLTDGQNRIGGDNEQGVLCINGEGAITDGMGRGCILTDPTTQFQCDLGAQATPGFAVSGQGDLEFNGNTEFWACATGDQGSYNIYTEPVDSDACVRITLAADACVPTSSSPPPSTPPPPPQVKDCPAALSGPYEFPHLIVPVDSSAPDRALGTSFFGEVTPTVSSLYLFDIPAGDAGKTCTLVFLFPEQRQLVTSSFSFSGNGGIDFSELSGNVNQGTTFNTAPTVQIDFGVTTVAPGNSYTIASFACPAGQSITFKLSASGNTNLRYFEDFNPPAIGAYITKC